MKKILGILFISLMLAGNACGATVTDSGTSGQTWTLQGNAELNSDQTKIYDTSLDINGNGGDASDTEGLRSNGKIPNGALTISVWLYLTATPTYGMIVDDIDFNNTNTGIIAYVDSDRAVSFRSYGGVKLEFNATTSDTITLNTWTHVILTWDGTTNANGVKAYINNGTPAEDTSTSTLGTHTYNLSIGLKAVADAWGFPGYMCDVRHYDRVVTSDERIELYGDGDGRSTAITADDEFIWLKMGDPIAATGWTHTINGVVAASMASVNGVAKASIAEINQT